DITPYINQLSGDIPEYEDLMGTIAQQLEDKGIQKGIEQERQASLERERRKFLDAARALLDNGVSLEVVIKSTGLSREELEQLRH
ncbi:ISNCY family transposase, partial [Salmonella enterica]|nr:ISNCY family transposase [Salmonella enterica]